MEETAWLTPEEARAWRGLQLMQMSLEREMAKQLSVESGLSYPEYVVLVALTDQAQGRLRLHELGSLLGWEKSRVSHQITRMVRRQLVTKQHCPDDRRGAFVVLTDTGRDEIESAAPGHVRLVRELFIDRLTDDQLRTLAGIAENVLSGMDAGSA